MEYCGAPAFTEYLRYCVHTIVFYMSDVSCQVVYSINRLILYSISNAQNNKIAEFLLRLSRYMYRRLCIYYSNPCLAKQLFCIQQEKHGMMLDADAMCYI